MADEVDYPLNAPLGAYLELAERYYREDRLDLAMRVVTDAFEARGWAPGLWTAFYNELRCEAEARDASLLRRVDEKLSIELDRRALPALYRGLRSAAVGARETVAGLLRVEFAGPVMITVFVPDAPVDFIVGSYGYVSHKIGLDKICVPWHTIEAPAEARDTLVHEFTHVATHELAGDAVPRWLNEGLATFVSRDLSLRHARFVVEAEAKRGRMLSAGHLEAALNSADMRKDDPASVQAAYYLAASLVGWWEQQRGLESVRDALVRIGQGVDPGSAVRQAAGMSISRMEREWRQSLTARRHEEGKDGVG